MIGLSFILIIIVLLSLLSWAISILSSTWTFSNLFTFHVVPSLTIFNVPLAVFVPSILSYPVGAVVSSIVYCKLISFADVISTLAISWCPNVYVVLLILNFAPLVSGITSPVVLSTFFTITLYFPVTISGLFLTLIVITLLSTTSSIPSTAESSLTFLSLYCPFFNSTSALILTSFIVSSLIYPSGATVSCK